MKGLCEFAYVFEKRKKKWNIFIALAKSQVEIEFRLETHNLVNFIIHCVLLPYLFGTMVH